MLTGKICRICSSPGEYEIFSVIPSYLHASQSEFYHWEKKVSTIIEETTGLVVSPNDGLPTKICALCISYLKHAAIFRQQAINNATSLNAARKLILMPDKAETKNDDFSSINDKDFNLLTTRKINTTKFISNAPGKSKQCRKNVFSDDNGCYDDRQQGKNRVDNNFKMYLNLLFDNESNKESKKIASFPSRKCYFHDNAHETNTNENNYTNSNSIINNRKEILLLNQNFDNQQQGDEFECSSSENDTEYYDHDKNFFNYREKNFEEDDVMDLDIIKEANIIINIPEHSRERKCRACFRRYMSEESFTDHTETCLELKFLILIEETNRLLEVRRNKTISPHEFIRRMIFILKKTYQWLNTMDINILGMNNNIIGRQVNSFEKFTNNKSDYNKELLINKKTEANNVTNQTSCIQDDFVYNNGVVTNTNNVSLKKIIQKMPGNTDSLFSSDKIFNISALNANKIEAKDFNFTSNSLKSDSDMILHKKIDKELKYTFENQLQIRMRQSHNQQPSENFPHLSQTDHIKISFPVRCGTCETNCESISLLEKHNSEFHNSNNSNNSRYEDHKSIIDLFEGNSDNIEGTVDLMNIFD